MAAEGIGPVASTERIEVLDVLRGFALFGMLWMHIPTRPADGMLNHIAGGLSLVIADGKFHRLFSFLFGLGFAVQFLRAEARGVKIVPVYLRRMLGLLAIGLAHEVFLWWGDALKDYALLGLLLMLFHRCSPRTLLLLALLCLTWTSEGPWLLGTVNGLQRRDPEVVRAEQLDRMNDEAIEEAHTQARRGVQARGTYSQLVPLRAVEVWSISSWTTYLVDKSAIFCMFLLGFCAGRRGIFHNVTEHLPFLRRVMWWGLAVGLPLNIADVAGSLLARSGFEWPGHMGRVIFLVGRVALSLSYTAAIPVAMQSDFWHRRLRPIAWLGRMGLSNYLLQSVAITILFYGYALGLMPYASNLLSLVLTPVIWILQIPLSIWWLKRFRFGPAEWLWRSITYGKAQPMRVEPAV